MVWRRGQRQQRQPAGQPREQRGGGGLGRGKQPWRGRDPGAQPEQPGRAGDHPNPGRRRRRRRVCIHRPEERLPPPRLLRLLPPPPLEPGAHQHPTSPRGRRLRARRGRRAPEARAGDGAGSGANSLGSAARPHAPPLPRAGSPSSSSSASAAARAAAAAPQARPRLAASPGSGLRPALTPGPPRRRGRGREQAEARGAEGAPGRAPAELRFGRWRPPALADGAHAGEGAPGQAGRRGSTSSSEPKPRWRRLSQARPAAGRCWGRRRGPCGPLSAWLNLGRGRRVPRGCCLQPPTPSGHRLPLGTGRLLSLENLPNTFLRPQRVLCPGGPYPTSH